MPQPPVRRDADGSRIDETVEDFGPGDSSPKTAPVPAPIPAPVDEDRLISLRDLKAYLRANLRLEVRLWDANDYGDYGERERFEVKVTLELEGEPLTDSSDTYSVSFPSRD